MAMLQEIKVPLLAVNDTSLTVVDICFEHGAAVNKGDVLMVFETSKTTYDVAAETAGFIAYSCEKGSDYEVNAVVAHIYASAEEVPAPKTAGRKSKSVAVTEFKDAVAYWEGETLISPAAIELMQQHQLDAAIFKGLDFVSKKDVEIHLGIYRAPVKKQSSTNREQLSLPVDPDKVTVKPLTSAKKKEIEFLSSVQSTGLTSTINTIVDTNGIFVHVNQSLQFLKNSLLPVIVYETARLLQQYPALNAYYTGDAVAYYKKVNIGFAIDIDKGLKVLHLKDAAEKSIGEIEDSIMQLSDKYMEDKLQLEDLTDISFTVTDLSSEGVSFFRPLVNMMNSAILGVSAVDEKLQRCILTITFDHRITEGRLAARFLGALKERLESYRSQHVALPNQDISCFKCLKKLKEDITDVGFTRCITPKGEEAYICQSCLKGF